jgi:uncharacterized protein YwlG (UPF0340 family)
MPLKNLKIEDLAAAYRTASYEEAIEMANLGAAAYEIVRDSLREQWDAAMGAEEAVKADIWRSEGRMSALEEFKAKLKEAESLSVRLASAEVAAEQLRTSIDSEVSRRVGEQVESLRKDYELMTVQKIHTMEKAMIVAEEGVKHLPVYQEKISVQAAQLAQCAEEIGKLREELHQMELERVQASTKSSHALGKLGEATVLDMLTNVVLPVFPYSSVKDMTSKAHAADFHLWIMTPHGRRVKVLVDAKNYSKPVNTEEIMKLYADVDADEEAHCGMMISLSTPIHKMKQFEFRVTERHKPVVFLTFRGMETEYQHELTCWAINALLAIVKEMSTDERNYIMENIDSFLSGMMGSLTDLDGAIQAQSRVLTTMRQIKTEMIRKITTFRTEANIDNDEEDDILDTIKHEADGCITILKATGQRCGKSVFNGGEKCRHHTSRRTRATGEDD